MQSESRPQPWLQGYLAALDDFRMQLDETGSLPELRQWIYTACADTEALIASTDTETQPTESGSVVGQEAVRMVAQLVREELGNWMLGQLDTQGLADAIHDEWPPFSDLDIEQQKAFVGAVYREIYG